MLTIEPKGLIASWLRRRRDELAQKYHIPEDLLPGSLTRTTRRCAKENCHCAQDEGHPIWQLSFCFRGEKRVEWIPADWAEEVQRRVHGGREHKDAVSEVLAANAMLLALWRQQERRGRRRELAAARTPTGEDISPAGFEDAFRAYQEEVGTGGE